MSDYRRVAFTGTREGLSAFQREQLERWFFEHRNRIEIFVHGCCIGADIEAHEIARRVYGPALLIVVWPSTSKTRAPIPADADNAHSPKAATARNYDIVLAGDIVLACPLQMEPQRRGGTWHAVQAAKANGRPVEYFWRHPTTPSKEVE